LGKKFINKGGESVGESLPAWRFSDKSIEYYPGFPHFVFFGFCKVTPKVLGYFLPTDQGFLGH